MHLVIAGVVQIIMIILGLMKRAGRMDLFNYVLPFYLLTAAVVTVLIYKEWVPAVFRSFPKADFEFTTLVSFIILNAIPLADMKFTLFGMCPIFLIASYV